MEAQVRWTDAFGTRGYGATSLDDLARDLGVRKQTILEARSRRAWRPPHGQARQDVMSSATTAPGGG